MRNKLKLKILAGFMLLLSLLIVAGAISIYEFIKLSRSFNSLIEDNYKSIEASRTMLEALERKDSGLLLTLLGQSDNGMIIIISADSAFMHAFAIAVNNVTETDEDRLIEDIKQHYDVFRSQVELATSVKSDADKMNFYHNEIYFAFLDVKHAVNELMVLNQNRMYQDASLLKEKSYRAIMPGIVAIIGAGVFSLMLSFFISKYFISPLSELSAAIRAFSRHDKQLNSNIRSEDEIKKIEMEVNNLIARLTKQE
jgi:methyl-accepting chemotaxis protein